MSDDFGWQYPPGAESDPRAPWNQDDPCEICECSPCECEPVEDDPDRKRDEEYDRMMDRD